MVAAALMLASACAPKKSSKKDKAPSANLFQAHMKVAGFKLDEKSKAFEGALSADMTKTSDSKLQLTVKIEDPSGLELPAGSLNGDIVASASVPKPNVAVVAAVSRDGSADIGVKFVCEGKCTYATAFITLKAGEGDAAKTYSAGLGFDFKNGLKAEKPSQKAQSDGKPKKK